METIILSSLSLEDIATQVAERVYNLQQRDTGQKEETQEDDFLTIDQASEVLNLAKPTIYSLTCKKEIPYIKKRKRLYFKKSELIEWLNMGRKSTKREIEKEAEDFLRRNKMENR
jgi:excisionase family DNA binding protein